MIRRLVGRMTGFAVRRTRSLVIEIGWQPSCSIMAGHTLIAIVIGWFIKLVAT